MSRKILFALGLSVLVFSAGCYKEPEPEGPAEQIGRGIDQIRQGIDRMSREEQERRGDGSSEYGSENLTREERARRAADEWERKVREEEERKLREGGERF